MTYWVGDPGVICPAGAALCTAVDHVIRGVGRSPTRRLHPIGEDAADGGGGRGGGAAAPRDSRRARLHGGAGGDGLIICICCSWCSRFSIEKRRGRLVVGAVVLTLVAEEVADEGGIRGGGEGEMVVNGRGGGGKSVQSSVTTTLSVPRAALTVGEAAGGAGVGKRGLRGRSVGLLLSQILQSSRRRVFA